MYRTISTTFESPSVEEVLPPFFDTMSPPVITGSCVCEKIRYELNGQPIMNIICHCDTCRKTTGSVFMANSMYLKEVS